MTHLKFICLQNQTMPSDGHISYLVPSLSILLAAKILNHEIVEAILVVYITFTDAKPLFIDTIQYGCIAKIHIY